MFNVSSAIYTYKDLTLEANSSINDQNLRTDGLKKKVENPNLLKLTQNYKTMKINPCLNQTLLKRQ